MAAPGEPSPETPSETTSHLCPAEAALGCRADQLACAMDSGTPSCIPCDRFETADDTGSCVSIEGEQVHHAFAEFTVESGGEVLGLCQSWTLRNDEDLYVNAVELWQNQMSHHSNWTFVPEDQFAGPDGVWPCGERDYSQLAAAISGGVLYAQSTQAEREVQQFPEGAVIRIPARSRIIGDVHLLNTTSEANTGHLELTLFTLPPAEVDVVLAPFHLTFEALDIPARSDSRFEATCWLGDQLRGTFGSDPELWLHYLLPHTHAQGQRMFMQVLGGPQDGEMLMDVRGFNGEARGKSFRPPVELTGLDGLRFGCEFTNPRDENIGWGFGDQEMCELLGFMASPVGFESRADGDLTSLGEPEGMPTFTTDCESLIVGWQAKL